MIIFRYLAKEILMTLFAATMVLLVIFVTNQSVQFLQRTASGEIPVTQLLHLIVLQIPLLVPYLLPLGLYLGVLLTLGRMHLESEMTVLSACGMSRAKLAMMIFVIALLVASVVAWLMASVVPKAQGDINRIVNNAAAVSTIQQVIPNRFMTFGQKTDNNKLVFYAGEIQNHAVLHNVFLAKHEKSDDPAEKNKWGVVVAKSALEKVMPNGSRYLIFNDGYRYSGVPGEKKYRVVQFGQYGMKLFVADFSALNAVQYYSLLKLWLLSPKDCKAAAELQWRMAMPISTLVFALLAIPLSEVRPRYGKFTQLLPAILIYAGYADLIFLTRAWIRVGHISPALGMWWVHGLALLLAIILMLYRFGWRRIRLLLAGTT